MPAVILQVNQTDNFKDGIYLALAIGAAILLFVLSRKFRRKG